MKKRLVFGWIVTLLLAGMMTATVFAEPTESPAQPDEGTVSVEETPSAPAIESSSEALPESETPPEQPESSPEVSQPAESAPAESVVPSEPVSSLPPQSWVTPSEDEIYSAPVGDGTSAESILLPEVEVDMESHSHLPSTPEQERNGGAWYGILTGVGLLLLAVVIVLVLFGNFRVGKSAHSSGRMYAKQKNYPQRKHLLADKYYSRSGRKRRY